MKKWMSEFRYMMPFMVLSGPSTNSNPSQRSQALQRYSLYKSFKAMNGGQHITSAEAKIQCTYLTSLVDKES